MLGWRGGGISGTLIGGRIEWRQVTAYYEGMMTVTKKVSVSRRIQENERKCSCFVFKCHGEKKLNFGNVNDVLT